MSEITSLTLVETLDGLTEKKFSDKELNRAYRDKVKKLNSRLNAFLRTNDREVGVPVAVKDVIITEEIETTAGSKILEGFVPPYQSTVIEKLIQNGCNVLGKTNCDEFAMGSSGENSAYGVTKNPWDLDKVPGGSSSGSAVAVSADLCVFALGSDTGGSIRQPASLCGVVGLKPTYGLVSRWGLIAFASSLDCVGPITKSVEDASLVLDWISGSDGRDSNCSRKYVHNPEKLKSGISARGKKGLRVGVPKEFFSEGLDGDVKKVVEEAVSRLEELGARIVEVSLPHSRYALSAYYIIAPSEASSNLARYDGIRFGKGREFFGAEVKRRIMLGTFSLSHGYYEDYFAKAAKVRTLVKSDFDKAFNECDVIVGPVSPTTAWDLGAKIDDPLSMYLSDVYTIPANLAGIPGLSVPCGFSSGLPVGLQILGNRFDEETVLRVGCAYERATGWSKQKPKIV